MKPRRRHRFRSDRRRRQVDDELIDWAHGLADRARIDPDVAAAADRALRRRRRHDDALAADAIVDPLDDLFGDLT